MQLANINCWLVWGQMIGVGDPLSIQLSGDHPSFPTTFHHIFKFKFDLFQCKIITFKKQSLSHYFIQIMLMLLTCTNFNSQNERLLLVTFQTSFFIIIVQMFRIMFDLPKSSICIKDLLLHIKECSYKNDQYCSPERDLNLGPQHLSLLEFETWPLRPLGYYGQSQITVKK